MQEIFTRSDFAQGDEKTVAEAAEAVIAAASRLQDGIRPHAQVLNLTDPADRGSYFAATLERGAPFGIPGVDEDFFGIQPGQLIALVGRQKSTKALALDTPLPTPGGWTTMGEVQPGNWLLDSAGKPCRVLDVTPVMHDRPCYAVEFRSGERIIADGDHRWVTDRKEPGGKRSAGVRTTDEIRSTLRYAGASRHRIPVAGPMDLPDADLPVDPYILGYWLGDGVSVYPVITCGRQDYAHLACEVERAGYHIVSNKPDNETGSVRRVRISTQQKSGLRQSLGWELRQLGVIGNKHIPMTYLRAGRQQRLALLQGIMDADGCATDRGAFIIQKSPCLIYGVMELMLSLGMRPDFKLVLVNSQPYFKLSWYGSNASIFRMDRKSSIQSKSQHRWEKHSYRYVKSVEEVPSVPVRCLAVDSPDHTYLAGRGMIPTHNTFLALNSAVRAWLEGWDVLFYTFEMGAAEIRDRAYALGAHVNPENVRRRDFTPAQRRKIEDFMDQLETDEEAGLNFRISEGSGSFTIDDLQADIAKFEPHMVYIDGVYFIIDRHTRKAAGADWVANENVARELKTTARQSQAGLVATTQAQEKQHNHARAGIEGRTMMGGTGLLRTPDLVMGADMDRQTRVLTLNCVMSRYAHVGTAKYRWDWDAMILAGALDSDLEADMREMGI